MPSIGSKIIPRGKGWYNTGTTVDDKYYDSTQSDYVGCPSEILEGLVVTMRPRTKSTKLVQDSGGDGVMLFVRNVGAINLLPGYLVSWEAGNEGKRVDGYTTTTAAQAAGVVDPFFAAAGVPPGECFWLIVKGRTLVYTDKAPDSATGEWSRGRHLVALTGATSGCTTSGHVAQQGTTGTSTGTDWSTEFGYLQNAIGRALSAQTSAQTNRQCAIQLDLPADW